MEYKKWLIAFFIVLTLNMISLVYFMIIHVELWDYSMNSILISREEFAIMNRRGLIFFILSISSAMLFIKTIIVVTKVKPN